MFLSMLTCCFSLLAGGCCQPDYFELLDQLLPIRQLDKVLQMISQSPILLNQYLLTLLILNTLHFPIQSILHLSNSLQFSGIVIYFVHL